MSIKARNPFYTISYFINIISKRGPEGLAKELALGDVPDNLAQVLATIALGSPAVLAFVTFQNAFSDRSAEGWNQLFNASILVAESFRSYFNQPEAISIIDVFNQGKEDYWLSIMDYCISGCLISVLDECFYMNCDGNNEEKDKNKVA